MLFDQGLEPPGDRTRACLSRASCWTPHLEEQLLISLQQAVSQNRAFRNVDFQRRGCACFRQLCCEESIGIVGLHSCVGGSGGFLKCIVAISKSS